MQDYNFACGSVWVWNLVSGTKVKTKTEGVWEQGAEEDIWAEEGWSGGGGGVGEKCIARSFVICGLLLV
jgi:hypothetical protein